MVSLYDRHNMHDKIIEVFANMEELSVKPEEDTVGTQENGTCLPEKRPRRQAEASSQKCRCKLKYIHFKGERVRAKRCMG